MPRRLLGILILLLVSASVLRAQGDAVLLRLGMDSVCRAEAEYYFHRSAENDWQAFLPKFVDYKVQVRYARELGLDTVSDYVRQKTSLEETLQHGRRSVSLRRSYGGEWVKLVHVTSRLSQQADKQALRQATQAMDSIYQALEQGTDGLTLGDTLPWMQTRHLLQEWQEQLKGLEKGQFSRPFQSPLGVHVVAWLEKRAGVAPQENRPASDSLFRKREVEEGLLLVALEKHWAAMPCTETELEVYFKRHQADYGGGIPHFYGAVIHCRDKKQAKAIKKYLKKYPQELWSEAVKRMPANVADSCRMEEGLFRIGQQPFVDKLVFGCGAVEPLADYPYAWVLGKKLKKGPDDYRLVRQQVEIDCREARKKADLRALEQRYRVEINEEVLKTVNNIGNK